MTARRALQALAAATGASAFALYVDAPVGDAGDGSYARARRPQVFPEWLHDVARAPVFASATLVSKFYLSTLNRTEVEGVDALVDALDSLPEGTALITVSNHSATVDDPGVIANMMPWRFALPWNGRWSLCSQEYCYTKGRLLSALFFGAKTLPIKRGAGIDHPMLEDIFDKVEQGRWVHIFPEGKIDQHESLGGRPSPAREQIGRLKWGVGKLIARATQRPVVVPFYSANMERIMPQNERNQLISVVPKTGQDIRVVVGEPISFDDLFEKFASDRVAGRDGAAGWLTQQKEKALYSAITRRIETALLELEKRATAA